MCVCGVGGVHGSKAPVYLSCTLTGCLESRRRYSRFCLVWPVCLESCVST